MAKGHDGYTSKPRECTDCGAPLPIPRGLRMVRCRSCQTLRKNALSLLSMYRIEEEAEAEGKWAFCSVEGCKHMARHPNGTYCSTHQWRHSTGKDMSSPIRFRVSKGIRRCNVVGCEGKHIAKGYCSLHYGRWRRGLPGADLTRRKRRLISPERQVRLETVARVEELTRELIETRKYVEGLESRIQEREREELLSERRLPKQKKCAKCGESFLPNATRRMLCKLCFSLANANTAAEGVW